MAFGPLLISDMKTPGARALGVFLWRAFSVFSCRAFSVFSCKTLGVFLGALLALSAFPGAACPLPEGLERESVQVAGVHDGDSVRLADGRRVRLIGINAPELAREGRPAEPLAKAAREELKKQLVESEVLLVQDQERHDHYGRTLGHLFTLEGKSLEAALLRQGLGFHIAIPPNMTLASCLSEAEGEARAASLGVWAENQWPALEASGLTLQDTGFQRIRGTITDVSRGGGSVWLELDGPLVLKVPDSVWSSSPVLAPGQRIEVRGWVTSRAGSRAVRRGFKPLVLSVPSGFAIERPAAGRP